MPRLRPASIAILACSALLAGVLPSVAVAADGEPDPAFSDDGTLAAQLGDSNSQPAAVAVDGNGRIVVASQASGFGIGVGRFNPDGTPDATFGGGDGIATFSSGATRCGEFANAVAVQPDGKIVVFGQA